MAFLQHSRPHTPPQNCLCHKTGVQGQLTQFSSTSWKTFRAACDARGDEISKAMQGKWGMGPFGNYHRKCYQTYTAKSHVERVLSKRRKIDSTTTEVKPDENVCLRRSSFNSTNVKCCWICQEEKNDANNRRIKEKLICCQTTSAGNSLLEAAKARKDSRLIVSLDGRDAIAIEVCYHKSCYRQYTNLKQAKTVHEIPGEGLDEYHAAFEDLKEEIDTKLFKNFEVLDMSYLRDRFVNFLSVHGINNPLYRAEKLKSRILKAYPGRVSFWHPRKRSQTELVFCTEVSKGQIIESAVSASGDENMDIPVHNDDINYLYHAAKTVRASLLSQDVEMPWPPYANDLKEDKVLLPTSVHNLLSWILTDDDFQHGINEDERVELVDQTVKRLVQSFGQDLMYAASKGKNN